jgi:glycosyl transferase family 25
MNMKDLEVYLINLDRSPDRLSEMDERLKKMGLKYKRVAAVEGWNAKFGDAEIDPRKYSLAHGKILEPTEAACYMSHYNAMREFLESKEKYALILEDDMEFDKDFADVLEALLERGDWDIAKLNGGHGGGNIRIGRELVPGRRIAMNLFHQSKSGAYVINRKAAKSYVINMLPMFVPFDHELAKFWKYGIRGVSVAPFPSHEVVGGASTIDYKAIKMNRKPWYRKGPTALYRSYIAMRRPVHVFFNLFKK